MRISESLIGHFGNLLGKTVDTAALTSDSPIPKKLFVQPHNEHGKSVSGLIGFKNNSHQAINQLKPEHPMPDMSHGVNRKLDVI